MNRSDKPTVPEVLPLVRAYYQKPGNIVGGNLHLVLDDENVENEHIMLHTISPSSTTVPGESALPISFDSSSNDAKACLLREMS